MTKGTLTLGDLFYDVYETRAFVENQNMELYLALDVYASFRVKCQRGDKSYLSDLQLFHDNNFNTHVTCYEELKDKKYVWENEFNEDGINAGCLNTVEYESVMKSTIEILDVNGNELTVHWTGDGGVYWAGYGLEPFDTTFTVTLPEKVTYVIDVAKCTRVKLSENTELELLNIDDFRKESERIDATREWDDFNTVLKFKVIHGGMEYPGEIVFKNGMKKFTTLLDDKCPIALRLKDVNIHYTKEYEKFVFEID